MPEEEFNFDDIDKMLAPIDKEANKVAMIEKLNAAFTTGTIPFIDFTQAYVFLVYPTADGKEWNELSFMREDGNLSKSKQDPETAVHDIKEEIVRGLSEFVEINVNQVTAIATKHAKDPKAFIAEIVATLPASTPILRSQVELPKVIDLVKSA
ncbi:MAG: hypothetical protein GYA24_07340 [Candidatus Lokiarchaeota archaeon]|nr:hypothetical protein [Candidatus Lokiarchaeota archaeon]